jgi:hypothetical protein
MLCGVFGAAGIALGAAILAYLGAPPPHAAKFIASGTTTALLLLLASGVAGFSSASRDFWIAGGDPTQLRDWAWNGEKWRSEIEMLDATAQRLGNLIDKNRDLLAVGAQRVNAALLIALASIAAGVFAFCLA